MMSWYEMWERAFIDAFARALSSAAEQESRDGAAQADAKRASVKLDLDRPGRLRADAASPGAGR